MSEQMTTEAPRRGRRRTAGTVSRSTRRRGAPGPELVGNLDQMIDQLIKENRTLKRQVDRMASKGTAVASGSIERTLRAIQRRLQRAVGGGPTRRRRAAATGAGRRRRTTSSPR
jgi:hypothetical protein